MDYSNQLVNKIVDKEADMVAMRKQFRKDNQEKHEANNYEFKRTRYITQMKAMNDSRRKD